MMFAPKMTRAQWRLYDRKRRRVLTWRHRITAAAGLVSLAILAATGLSMVKAALEFFWIGIYLLGIGLALPYLLILFGLA